MIDTLVWGTGNVGRAAIRAVDAHPGLRLAAVIVHNPDKVGRDAGVLAGMDRELGVVATDDLDAVLSAGPGAVVYAASGDIRPDDALADVARALRAGAVVVTPAIYALYDPMSAPPEVRDAPRCGNQHVEMRTDSIGKREQIMNGVALQVVGANVLLDEEFELGCSCVGITSMPCGG